jgi:hypothetical protein
VTVIAVGALDRRPRFAVRMWTTTGARGGRLYMTRSSKPSIAQE